MTALSKKESLFSQFYKSLSNKKGFNPPHFNEKSSSTLAAKKRAAEKVWLRSETHAAAKTFPPHVTFVTWQQHSIPLCWQQGVWPQWLRTFDWRDPTAQRHTTIGHDSGRAHQFSLTFQWKPPSFFPGEKLRSFVEV